MRPVIFAMPENEDLGARLASRVAAKAGHLEHRRFPDGESYLRFMTRVEGRSVALACSLHHPDDKAVPLLLAAAALKDLGARRVGLVAPYLAYMRQDVRFKEGEAVTSGAFAKLLSSGFDWIATIDPHLHRHASLDEIYSVPVSVGHATPLLADYLRPFGAVIFLVGPDEESEQWVSALSLAAGVPYVTMRKTRHSDRSVSITFTGLERFHGRRPILVDDMISSATPWRWQFGKSSNLALPRPSVCRFTAYLLTTLFDVLKRLVQQLSRSTQFPGQPRFWMLLRPSRRTVSRHL